MLSAYVIQEIEEHLRKEHGVALMEKVRGESGGSINDAYSFDWDKEKFFVKVNSAAKFPRMFGAEAKGLKLLARHSSLTVPKVIAEGVADQEQFLLLGYLQRKSEDPMYFYALGKGLAQLHRVTQEDFGLDHNNYIGSLPQDNTRATGWNEFFVCRRIEPLLKQAIDLGELPWNCHSYFEVFFKKLGEIFPTEKPALLHGDLWSGNKMNTRHGASIFDPAVYFGHREMDIAMTRLFGGFTADFYEGYENEYPLEKGWEGRVEMFNLYPLLVHTVLFGGSYASDVINIIRKFR